MYMRMGFRQNIYKYEQFYMVNYVLTHTPYKHLSIIFHILFSYFLVVYHYIPHIDIRMISQTQTQRQLKEKKYIHIH